MHPPVALVRRHARQIHQAAERAAAALANVNAQLAEAGRATSLGWLAAAQDAAPVFLDAAITWRETASILGRSLLTVATLVDRKQVARGPRWAHRQLSKVKVEALALSRSQPHTGPPDWYRLGHKQSRATAPGQPGKGSGS